MIPGKELFPILCVIQREKISVFNSYFRKDNILKLAMLPKNFSKHYNSLLCGTNRIHHHFFLVGSLGKVNFIIVTPVMIFL